MNILLCPLSDPGFSYPVLGVGRELRRRGHDVRLLGDQSAAAPAAAAGVEFVPAEGLDASAAAFRAAVWAKHGADQFQAVLRAAKELHADALLTSELCHGALLAGEVLDLPVLVLGLAAYLWRYQTGGQAQDESSPPSLRDWRENTVLGSYARTRELVGLAPRADARPQTPLLGAGLLLRGHPAFEHPGALLPPTVHHVGPCLWERPADPHELAEIDARLGRVGKPVVYVHLGRTFDGEGMWPRLNAAFTDGPFQAVVELGRTRDPLPADGADLLVVSKPWMTPLIERSELVLTNATSAPVLAGLSRGRPLLVSPAGSEQPALAEACTRAGVAVRFPNDLRDDGTQALAAAHTNLALRHRARKLGADLAAMDGPGRAADLLETTASRNLPTAPHRAVTRPDGAGAARMSDRESRRSSWGLQHHFGAEAGVATPSQSATRKPLADPRELPLSSNPLF